MLNLKTLFTLGYGLYIVSSVSKDGKINGLIANSVAQVTAEPIRTWYIPLSTDLSIS